MTNTDTGDDPQQVAVGDIWNMRRPHPCGGRQWRVHRIGADIGLTCLTCDRRVLLTRRRFEQRARSRVTTRTAAAMVALTTSWTPAATSTADRPIASASPASAASALSTWTGMRPPRK